MPDELLYRDEAYRIVGACVSVHKEKGNGFSEPVYQDSLEIELEFLSIPFDRQRNTISSSTATGRSATPTHPTSFVSKRSWWS